MRRILVFAAAVASSLLVSAVARAEVITLAEALERAGRRPSVAGSQAAVDATLGELDQARRPLYNPALSASAGPRSGGGATGFDVELSLGQTIELGGKRGARRDVAAARVDLGRAELAVADRQARLEAWQAYHLALVAKARLAAATDVERLAEEVDLATSTRLGLGGGTQLQVNLTAAEVGRARHERLDAETGLAAALSALASAVGAASGEQVEPAGELPVLGDLPWTEEAFVARATAERPELRASKAAVAAADAETRLADAQATPDVTLGVVYGLEQAVDTTSHIVLFGASVALPLRNRNQGARRAARARVRGATIQHAWVATEVEREARLAYQTYVRALAAVRGFDKDVNEHLAENLDLARDSFTSGKIDYFEFNLARRELFAARMAYLDAVAEAIAARVELQRAIGTEELR